MKTGFIQRQIINFSEWELPTQVSDRVVTIWKEFDSQIIVERFTYWSDGLKIAGCLTYPKDEQGKLPCIIYNRGGNRDFSKLNPFQVYGIMGRLASRGYVVIGSQYRGTSGSEGQDEFGGADLHDVFNLIPLLRELPLADVDRLGIFGWSRGGMMTYLALKQAEIFQAAVIGGGEADLVASEAYRPEMRKVHQELIHAKDESEFQAKLKERSAVYWTGKITPKTPLLILHGGADDRVRPDGAKRMYQELKRLHRTVELKIFENDDHGITKHKREMFKMVIDWFDRFLKNKEAFPNIKPHGE